MSAPDLGLITTEDLLTELERRYDYMIWAGVKDLGSGTARHEHDERFHGHVVFCSGMALDLIRSMRDWARGLRQTIEDDEDPPDD